MLPVFGKNIGGSSVIGSFFKNIKKKKPINANDDNNKADGEGLMA